MTIAKSGDLLPEHVVLTYHERTKHHHSRFAASLGYLDWANQPNPFRRYEQTPLVHLPILDAGERSGIGSSTQPTTYCRLRSRSTPSRSFSAMRSL
jgi:hypothetical protein